jgi:hypothetical protein
VSPSGWFLCQLENARFAGKACEGSENRPLESGGGPGYLPLRSWVFRWGVRRPSEVERPSEKEDAASQGEAPRPFTLGSNSAKRRGFRVPAFLVELRASAGGAGRAPLWPRDRRGCLFRRIARQKATSRIKRVATAPTPETAQGPQAQKKCGHPEPPGLVPLTVIGGPPPAAASSCSHRRSISDGRCLIQASNPAREGDPLSPSESARNYVRTATPRDAPDSTRWSTRSTNPG